MRIFLFSHLLSLCFLCCRLEGSAQGVGIGTTTPDPSARLEIKSTTRGFLIPRMKTADILQITLPAKGLSVYDSLTNQLMVNIASTTAPNWQNVISTAGWGVSGNRGTNTNDNFVGTIDNVAYLNFRVNNVPSGQIRADSVGRFGFNTAWGYHSVPKQSLSIGLTAVGAFSQGSDTTFSTINTSLGSHAMQFTHDVTNGRTDGINTAVGSFALQANIGGVQNTVFGAHAMDNAGGSNNIAIGVKALSGNIDGQNNIAIGNSNLSLTLHSSNNIIIGGNSGSRHNMGSGNILLGANTDITTDGLSNVIAIGQDVTVTDNNTVRIGNSATGSIGGQVGWTNFSDGRFKKDIKEDVIGLDFIARLRPVTYHLDATAIWNKQSKSGMTHPSTARLLAQQEKTVISGFSAQEVEKAAQAAGYAFSGVDKPGNDQSYYGLRYADFVAPLVKAIQEQQHIIESLQKEINAVEQQLSTKP